MRYALREGARRYILHIVDEAAAATYGFNIPLCNPDLRLWDRTEQGPVYHRVCERCNARAKRRGYKEN